jgi:hypothetical protein
MSGGKEQTADPKAGSSFAKLVEVKGQAKVRALGAKIAMRRWRG